MIQIIFYSDSLYRLFLRHLPVFNKSSRQVYSILLPVPVQPEPCSLTLRQVTGDTSSVRANMYDQLFVRL